MNGNVSGSVNGKGKGGATVGGLDGTADGNGNSKTVDPRGAAKSLERHLSNAGKRLFGRSNSKNHTNGANKPKNGHSNGTGAAQKQGNGYGATNGVARQEHNSVHASTDLPTRPNRASVDGGASVNSGSGTLSGGSTGSVLKGVAKVGKVLKVSLGGGRGSAQAVD